MITTDLSNSFYPVPKPGAKKQKELKRIKKKTNKLAKKERNRFSILQKNTTNCFLCDMRLELDKHEAFGGSNRQKSMEWGLVYYLCRICHSRADLDKETKQYLHDYARKEFIKKYGEEKFLKEFGKRYIAKDYSSTKK